MYRLSDYDYIKEIINFDATNEIFFNSLALTCSVNDNCICFFEDKRFIDEIIKNLSIMAGLICKEEDAHLFRGKVNLIICDQPKALYFTLHNSLENTNKFKTIIEDGCIIDDNAYIAPYNVIIKSGTNIAPFACINENVTIGNNCYVGSYSVIGSPGFNVFMLNGKQHLVKSRGGVHIGDESVILCNCTVQSAIYPESTTIIGNNCMIADKVAISHDSSIGDNCLLVSGTTICGFSKLEDGAYMGANSALKHVNIVGKNTKVGMGACINFNTEDNDIIAGFQALPLEQAKVLKKYNNSIINKENN